MEKIITTILFASVILLNTTQAQDKPIVRKGLIRAQLTISSATMLDYSESPFYFHGSLEGYLNKKTSLVGESYFYLGNISGESTVFDFNHSTFFGGSYHIAQDNGSLYIGLQPGVSFARIKTQSGQERGDLGISPLFSTVVGYNFFVHRFFHFFVQSRLVLGQHLHNEAISLNELRVSAGLGINLNTFK
ncbi:MAG: hypothetical protein COA32_15555 [Fluviicola sp.]|nr:MAG: hypothetical protein COA32_15555 [Fluviicola sp.]